MGSMNKEENPTDSPQEEVREDTEAETIALMKLHGNLTHFAIGAKERMFQSEIQLNAEVEIASMKDYMNQILQFYDSPSQESSQQMELDMCPWRSTRQ